MKQLRVSIPASQRMIGVASFRERKQHPPGMAKQPRSFSEPGAKPRQDLAWRKNHRCPPLSLGVIWYKHHLRISDLNSPVLGLAKLPAARAEYPPRRGLGTVFLPAVTLPAVKTGRAKHSQAVKCFPGWPTAHVGCAPRNQLQDSRKRGQPHRSIRSV